MQRALIFDGTGKKRLQRLVAGWAVFPEIKEEQTIPPGETGQKKKYQDTFRVATFIMLSGVCLGVIFGLLFIFSFVSLAVILAYLFSLQRKSAQIVREFDREYPTFLMMLASSVRAGADPVMALTSACQFFPASSVMGRELKKAVSLLQKGFREEEVFRSFAQDIRHPDISLLYGALLLSRRHGASLSECLMRLVKVTRQRQSFRRKIKAALAMQRFSALGIGLVAVFFCCMQLVANDKAVMATFDHPYGAKLLSSGFFLILSGLFWIMFLGRKRI